MSGNLYKEANRAARNAIDENGGWLNGVTAIVAENQDSENQHRVKVIIPSIDEDVMYDEWARQMVFCLGNGYGSAFIPPKGSEVVLFGQLGQKYNLFYASLYNEEMLMPEGFPDEMTVGVHAPGNLKFIAELLARVQAQNIEIVAAQLAKLTGQNIDSLAESLNKMTGENIESLAASLNKMTGENIEVTAEQLAAIAGQTVTINADGSITVHATGNAAVTATGVLTLQGRVVGKTGPPI